jgi:putative salt-induced outer membrane protein YdiY
MRSLVSFAVLAALAHAQSGGVLTETGFVAGRVVALDRDGVSVEPALGVPAVSLSWTAVRDLRAPGPLTVQLANGDRLTVAVEGFEGGRLLLHFEDEGYLLLDPGRLAAPVQPASAPSPPAPATPPESSAWSGKIALSATFRSGNVDSGLAALRAEAERKGEEDRLKAVLDAAYGETKGSRTAQSIAARIRYEHDWTKITYGYAQAEALHDDVQSVDLRAILSVGAGHKLWREDDKRFWSVEAGLSGIYEDLASGGGSDIAPAARLATQYKDVLFSNLEFEQLLEVLFPVTDLGDWIGRSLSVFSVPLSESLRMRASLELNYQASPAPGAENLDILSLIGLEYRF